MPDSTLPLPQGYGQPEGERLGWQGPDQGYAVGRFGAFVEQRGGEWLEARGPDTIRTLHAIWSDPAGGLWAVGGELDVRPLVSGVLAYRGKNVPKGAM